MVWFYNMREFLILVITICLYIQFCLKIGFCAESASDCVRNKSIVSFILCEIPSMVGVWIFSGTTVLSNDISCLVKGYSMIIVLQFWRGKLWCTKSWCHICISINLLITQRLTAQFLNLPLITCTHLYPKMVKWVRSNSYIYIMLYTVFDFDIPFCKSWFRSSSERTHKWRHIELGDQKLKSTIQKDIRHKS